MKVSDDKGIERYLFVSFAPSFGDSYVETNFSGIHFFVDRIGLTFGRDVHRRSL